MDIWRASDRYERRNGTTHRKIVIAIPRGLDREQQMRFVRTFCAWLFGERHAYEWVIHNPKAAIEGGDQPHVHI